VVYVTHDQSEALTMSDRIAVFHDGQVMQQGTPDVLYSQPRDAFVAGFIGENNMLSGTVEAIANGNVRVVLAGGLQVLATAVGELDCGAHVIVAVRPEAVHVSSDSPGAENTCRALVTSRIYLGDHQRLLTEIGDAHTVTVKVPAGLDASAGASVFLSWDTADCRAFPASTAAEAALNQESLN
jgi:putative spermidine/putrescine transport system ATP-binding protein